MKRNPGVVLLILAIEIQILQVSTTSPNDSLKLVHVLFRHGERTPTATYKTDPYRHWPEGWGQLTNRGKMQMYNLGLMLREHYKGFISEYYFPDKVYVLSSYLDRCIMSAQSLLAGLFPPVKKQIWNPDLLWQPIPVKYLRRSSDNLIAQKKKCPVYDAALQAAYKSERIQSINTKHKYLYQYLTENTGQVINNISTVETLHGTLEIEQLHDLVLPEWTKNVSMNLLHSLAAENFAIFTDNTLMKRLKGGPLLKEIISRMSQKRQNSLKPDLDVVLYAGHDLTIITLLRTLGFGEYTTPDYGASLIFELHEINNKHEVRVLYGTNTNFNVTYLDIKFCAKPCLLRDFEAGLQSVLPSDWEGECFQEENT